MTGWQHVRLVPADNGWQTIETAPKDGTAVLLWNDEDRAINIGRWDPAYTREWHALVNGEEASWSDYDDPPVFHATHWMPLPEPPA